MQTLTINNVNIDIHDGPIGVSVSGGADSSILLYILMKYAKGAVHVYTCANKAKSRTAPHYALKVIGKCIDMLNRNNVYHHVVFVDEQTESNMLTHGIADLNSGKINYLYTGVTANPPVEVTDKFTDNSRTRSERNPYDIKPFYTGNNNRNYRPFINVDKKVISGIYKELNVLDDIFPLTRSCEDLILTSGHCGHCWWCEERQWGFSRLE